MEEEKKKEFYCTKCSLQFDNNFVFNLHLSLLHKIKNDSSDINNESNKQIEICKPRLVSKSCKNDKPIKNRKTQTTQSNSNKFTSKPTLHENVATTPEGKKQFKCEICYYSCYQKSPMNRHVASVHDGKKPFKCEICDRYFSERGNLKKHVTSAHEELK